LYTKSHIVYKKPYPQKGAKKGAKIYRNAGGNNV
jgi:hypothetical protein